MRHIISYMLCALALLAGCSGQRTETGKAEKQDTLPLMVMQIRKCARLYTAEYRVHKIVTHDDTVRLKGSLFGRKIDFNVPFSSRKIAIPVDATIKAYVDFSEFSERNVTRRGDKIEIILPDPKVELVSSRVNHDEIRRQVALFRSDFSDRELVGYENQGRTEILNSVPQTGILDVAREGAAHVLVPMVAQLGFDEEDITITFRKKFTTADLPLILNKNASER